MSFCWCFLTKGRRNEAGWGAGVWGQSWSCSRAGWTESTEEERFPCSPEQARGPARQARAAPPALPTTAARLALTPSAEGAMVCSAVRGGAGLHREGIGIQRGKVGSRKVPERRSWWLRPWWDVEVGRVGSGLPEVEPTDLPVEGGLARRSLGPISRPRCLQVPGPSVSGVCRTHVCDGVSTAGFVSLKLRAESGLEEVRVELGRAEVLKHTPGEATGGLGPAGQGALTTMSPLLHSRCASSIGFSCGGKSVLQIACMVVAHVPIPQARSPRLRLMLTQGLSSVVSQGRGTRQLRPQWTRPSQGLGLKVSRGRALPPPGAAHPTRAPACTS